VEISKNWCSALAKGSHNLRRVSSSSLACSHVTYVTSRVAELCIKAIEDSLTQINCLDCAWQSANECCDIILLLVTQVEQTKTSDPILIIKNFDGGAWLGTSKTFRLTFVQQEEFLEVALKVQA
jgi:hypothetical protein